MRLAHLIPSQRFFVVFVLLCSISHATATPIAKAKRRALFKASPVKPSGKAATTQSPVLAPPKASAMATTQPISTSAPSPVTSTVAALNASSTSNALSSNTTAVNAPSTAPAARLLPTKSEVATATTTNLIANNFMVLLNPKVNSEAHIAKVEAGINSTAPCGGPAKPCAAHTSPPADTGSNQATLSPATEEFPQKNSNVKVLQQDSKASLHGPVSVRAPVTRRALSPFITTWNIFRLTIPGSIQLRVPGRGSSLGSFDWTTQYDLTAGQGVDIYIIDSGINPHLEFGDRLKEGVNIMPGASDTSDTRDILNHGTGVASIAAGAFGGVAVAANIIPIKVIDAPIYDTSIYLLGLCEAIVRTKESRRPSVVNIAAGIKRDAIATLLLEQAQEAGITVVAASGNSGENQCVDKIGGQDGIINVGATDSDDAQNSLSNFGPCVDLFSPGRGVLAANSQNERHWIQRSGTSYSAPAVAGVAATLLSKNPGLSPSDVKAAMLSSAVPAVQLLPAALEAGTPNLMLQIPKLESGES